MICRLCCQDSRIWGQWQARPETAGVRPRGGPKVLGLLMGACKRSCLSKLSVLQERAAVAVFCKSERRQKLSHTCNGARTCAICKLMVSKYKLWLRARARKWLKVIGLNGYGRRIHSIGCRRAKAHCKGFVDQSTRLFALPKRLESALSSRRTSHLRQRGKRTRLALYMGRACYSSIL